MLKQFSKPYKTFLCFLVSSNVVYGIYRIKSMQNDVKPKHYYNYQIDMIKYICIPYIHNSTGLLENYAAGCQQRFSLVTTGCQQHFSLVTTGCQQTSPSCNYVIQKSSIVTFTKYWSSYYMF